MRKPLTKSQKKVYRSLLSIGATKKDAERWVSKRTTPRGRVIRKRGDFSLPIRKRKYR